MGGIPPGSREALKNVASLSDTCSPADLRLCDYLALHRHSPALICTVIIAGGYWSSCPVLPTNRVQREVRRKTGRRGDGYPFTYAWPAECRCISLLALLGPVLHSPHAAREQYGILIRSPPEVRCALCAAAAAAAAAGRGSESACLPQLTSRLPEARISAS